MEPYLHLDSLALSYDGAQNAVSGVSLAIRRGEFVSFLGPSGSGKTTTLMMIAGFEQPSSGSVTLDGRRMESVPPHRRNIGIVFQNYALFPNLTVRKNVEFPLEMRGMPAAERRREADAALEMLALAPFADRRPRELSGGQQQRVALARALVFKPDILLLDEPLGALDKNLREQMQVEIKRLQQKLGITAVYVTHDQSEAMTLSDRIVVFRQGGIAQVGAPLEIYRRPADRFVAEFVGECNILRGRVLDAATGRSLVQGLGEMALPGAAGRADIEVVLRPEDAAIGAGAPNFQVENVVNYGNSALVTGILEGAPFRLRMGGRAAASLAVGDRLNVSAAPTDLWVLP